MSVLSVINIQVLFSFVVWYFVHMPMAIIRTGWDYVKAISQIFSFLFLLKTLVSPWKNMAFQYPRKGFDIHKILEVFTANSVARTVGLIIRIATMTLGIIIEVLMVLSTACLLVLWILFPVILISTFFFGLFSTIL